MQQTNAVDPVVNEMRKDKLERMYVARAINRKHNLGSWVLIGGIFAVPFFGLSLMAITGALFPEPLSVIMLLLELGFIIFYCIPKYRKFSKYYSSLAYELKKISPSELATAKSLLGDDFFHRKILS